MSSLDTIDSYIEMGIMPLTLYSFRYHVLEQLVYRSRLEPCEVFSRKLEQSYLRDVQVEVPNKFNEVYDENLWAHQDKPL